MKPNISIIISSFERLPLFRRCLWYIDQNRPSQSFELVVVDESSEANILGEIKKYSFPWKFVKVNTKLFEKETGVAKFFNNPSWTNNIGFRQSQGEYIFLQGNEVLPTPHVYDDLIKTRPNTKEHFISFTTTYDIPEPIVNKLDFYGENFTSIDFEVCRKFPLATPTFHTDVTNYLCLKSRKLWDAVGGYDERYVGGIGKEDSDFIRRCRKLPHWTDVRNMRRTNFVSLHQYHGGRTWHYFPKPEIITQMRWKEGEDRSKEVWDQWDGTYENKQPWPWGTLGIVDIITNE